MKILFTGGSSYIALFIIRELKKAGHEVTATFRKKPEEYEGIKKERVKLTLQNCTPVHNVSFGDEKFIDLIKSSDWDLFIHHAADATNPRSPDFDWLGATQKNTLNISSVLEALIAQNCKHTIITGSIYANDRFRKLGLVCKLHGTCNI